MKIVGQLRAILGLDKSKFDQGLNQAEGKAKSFGKVSMAAMAGFAAAITAAFAVAVKALKTTQLQGDALQATIGGIKQVAVTAAQNLASLDFSVSLRDAYRAGKALTMIYDDLADRQRSLNVLSSENTLEVARLQGILRNRTKTEKERLDAAKQIEEIYARETELRSGALDGAIQGEIDSLKTIYGLSQQQAQSVLDYATNYAKFTIEQHDSLTTAQKLQKELDTFPTLAGYMAKGWGDANDYAKELKRKQEALSQAMAVMPAEMRQWVSLWRPISDYTDEHRDTVAKLIIDYNNILSSRQRELNMADRLGDRLEQNNTTLEQTKRELADIVSSWNDLIFPERGFSKYGPDGKVNSLGRGIGTWGAVGSKATQGTGGMSQLFADPKQLAKTQENLAGLGGAYEDVNTKVLQLSGTITDAFYGALTGDDFFKSIGESLKRMTAQFAAAAMAAALLAAAISMIPGFGQIMGVKSGASFGDLFGKILKGGLGIGMAGGGEIPAGYPNDSFGPVMLSSGETVLTSRQSQWLKEGIKVQVSGVIRNRDLSLANRRSNFSN